MTSTIRPKVVATLALAILTVAVTPTASFATTARPVGSIVTVSSQRAISVPQPEWVVAAGLDTVENQNVAVLERSNRTAPDYAPQLVGVDPNGHTFPIASASVQMFGFSLTDNILTAGREGHANQVYSWPVTEHAGVTLTTLPTGDFYLGSAPNGWLFTDARGDLFTQDIDGAAPVELSKPFPDDSTRIGAVSGPTGAIAWTSTHIAFVPYSGAAVTPLDTSDVVTGDYDSIECYSASTAAVACGNTYSDEDESGISSIYLDPLDGAPAYAETTQCPSPAAMYGDVAMYDADGNSESDTRRGDARSTHQASTTSASDSDTCTGMTIITTDGTLHHVSGPYDGNPVAGLGGFLLEAYSTTAGDTRIDRATTSGATSALVKPVDSIAEANSFSFHGHDIAWKQDTGPAQHRWALEHATLQRNHLQTGVTRGSTHGVADVTTSNKILATSGDSTAYLSKGSTRATIKVRTGNKTVTVTKTADPYFRYGFGASTVSLADHRLLYRNDSKYDYDGPLRIYNLHTHRSRTLSGVTAAAISSHYLDYVDTNNILRQDNLDTGRVRTVATHLDGLEELFASGAKVGWNLRSADDRTITAAYRDMASGQAVVSLPAQRGIWSLSDAGVITEPVKNGDGYVTVPNESSVYHHAGLHFSIHPYSGGKPRLILSGNYLAAGPQIADHVMVWIDQRGRLQAQALN